MSKARVLADLGNTTADHSELSKLDGVSAGLTADELDKLDGFTGTAADLNAFVPNAATTGKSIAMSIVFG